MERVAIALGSNLGDRPKAIAFAVSRLRSRLADVRVSSIRETAPEGVGPQPGFLNGALVGEWAGGARELLDCLMGIETDAGRQRPHPGAARTLDLDLILFGTSILSQPGLEIPHPRFRTRGFVLEPLAEIAPEMMDPVSGRTIGQIWDLWRGSLGR